MSEMFNSYNDDIFLNENKVNFDDNKINNITKKYLNSNVNILEKDFFLKLRKQYFRVKKIDNYEAMQDKLYVGKSKIEKINFEISRIRSKANLESEILEQITNIEKLLSMYDNIITDELYNKIINTIIKIEISLDMQVGLFNELCSLFETELDNIDKGIFVDKMKYIKRK